MLQASADVKGAEADIAAARAMVTEARVSLDRTIIRSPIDLERNSCCDQRDHATVGSPASGTTAPPVGQATSPSPATPAAPTTSTQQTSATMGVVTYTAVIDVDAASQDIPPRQYGNRDIGWF
jgi:multidrug efflux pump subunit AcrA (membrane-fusion protein)